MRPVSIFRVHFQCQTMLVYLFDLFIICVQRLNLLISSPGEGRERQPETIASRSWERVEVGKLVRHSGAFFINKEQSIKKQKGKTTLHTSHPKCIIHYSPTLNYFTYYSRVPFLMLLLHNHLSTPHPYFEVLLREIENVRECVMLPRKTSPFFSLGNFRE